MAKPKQFEHGGVTYTVRPVNGLDELDRPYIHSTLIRHAGGENASSLIWGRVILFTNAVMLMSADGTRPAWLIPYTSSDEALKSAYDAFLVWIVQNIAWLEAFNHAYKVANDATLDPNA